jgi:uncharacterized delta-60 repeat protein
VLTRDLAYAVAIQRDGKLVVAGESGGARVVCCPGFVHSNHFALARYTADGRLDPSFGHGGKVAAAFGSQSREAASAVAIQADGKIVAAGSSQAHDALEFALARYTPDGRLDLSFGHRGEVLTDFPSSGLEMASAVAIQADGKIVAAGVNNEVTNPSIALARYTADGRLDPSFGRGGKVLTGPGLALALVIQPDGELVAAGGSGDGFALARFTADGQLDSSFGQAGKVETDFGNYAFAVAIQADGEIVAAGRSGPGLFALARFTADGSLDPSFGRGGTVVTRLGSGGEARAVAIQANRKIVAVGWIHSRSHDFALTRYKVDGRLDPGFGRSGKLLTNFGAG